MSRSSLNTSASWVTCFENVLRTIGLIDRQDPLAEKVAKEVIAE
jgi:hypothetical protein